jgi:hypothetical protein
LAAGLLQGIPEKTMVRNLDPIRVATMRAASVPPRPAKTQSATPDAPIDFKKLMQQQSVQSTPSMPSTPSVQTATPPQISAPAPSLHDVAALPNKGLMVNPTGNTPLGGVVSYNPNYYATPQAAQQLAQQLGGTVVDHSAHYNNNQAMLAIQLPNGITINAGNLMAVLNNSVYQENSRVMDGKIAELLNNNAVGTPGAGVGLYTVTNGQVTFDPSARPTVYAT